MQRKTELKSDRQRADLRGDAKSLLVSMADTTWRMFVPPAVLVTLGLWADVTWHTKPWLTIAGAAVGLGVGVMLVRVQLREATQ